MTDLRDAANGLRRWLLDQALPLWWEVGADRERGGFHEAIDLHGNPVARPHRARSIARMVFSYSEAGRLGWNGPWREAAQHALTYLAQHFLAEDATVVSVVDVDGKVSDASFDLYNQAFGLLALAHAHRAFGEGAGWRARGIALRTALVTSYAHPMGGHLERSGRAPQRSNPHMHLLEAALAWIAVDDDPAWRAMADRLVELCLDKFIRSSSGALHEFFAADWSPSPGLEGRICEPGHHYEWAFLLDRWARLTNRATPDPVSRLIEFADTHGLDPGRGVAINAVLADGSVQDPVARLWAQAERIRAYVVVRRDADQIAGAIEGLQRFLATPVQGTWYDQLAPDGRFVIEPARATSLYHIVGAITELSSIQRAES